MLINSNKIQNNIRHEQERKIVLAAHAELVYSLTYRLQNERH